MILLHSIYLPSSNSLFHLLNTLRRISLINSYRGSFHGVKRPEINREGLPASGFEASNKYIFIPKSNMFNVFYSNLFNEAVTRILAYNLTDRIKLSLY
jgi:hypothetical protein